VVLRGRASDPAAALSGSQTKAPGFAGGYLLCSDGNDNIVYTQHVEFTDFPLDEITLYFANDVIYLPSEH
jgi:hypothetical protein